MKKITKISIIGIVAGFVVSGAYFLYKAVAKLQPIIWTTSEVPLHVITVYNIPKEVYSLETYKTACERLAFSNTERWTHMIDYTPGLVISENKGIISGETLESALGFAETIEAIAVAVYTADVKYYRREPGGVDATLVFYRQPI